MTEPARTAMSTRPRSPSVWTLAVSVLLVGGAVPIGAPGQVVPVDVTGRVTDEATGEPIPDATVTLDERSTVTDQRGAFYFARVAPGRYPLVVRHLAYGEFTDQLQVGRSAVRIGVRMSETAIELDPFIVDVESREQRQDRVSGTRRNVVTREEIERSFGTADNVGSVLARSIPGVRLRTQSGRMGSPVCLEFRTARSLDDPLACHDPMVVMDGVRIAAPGILYQTLPLESVERMEVIPPGEAGARYGTDSQYGVLLIETRDGSRGEDEDRVTRPRGAYDWSAEPEPYPWAKVFGTAFVANAAGMALGVALARDCLSFNGLSDHFLESDCGTWSTAGARVALIAIPVGAVTFGAHRSGGSQLSKGRILQTAVGAMIAGVPGYIMATGGEGDAFSGADWVGGALLLVGIPALATVADRLFRDLRD